MRKFTAIKKSEVVRFRGFNIESDVFVYLMEELEKDRKTMSEMIQEAWDMISSNSQNEGRLKGYADRFVNKNADEIRQHVAELDPFMMTTDPKFLPMAAKIMVVGVINELTENPFSYRKMLLPDQAEEMDRMIEERGKSKFTTMIRNKRMSSRVAASIVADQERMEMAKKLMKELQTVETVIGKAITELKKEARGEETGLGDTSRAVGAVGGKYYSDATAYFFA